MTRMVDGRALAAELEADLGAAVRHLARPPCLAVVLVSGDPRQHRYAALKHRAAAAAGMRTVARELPTTSTTEDVHQVLDDLVADPDVDGVFIQLPLPAHLDPQGLHDRLPPIMDVDGLGTANRLEAGGRGLHRPAAVEAVMHVVAHHDVALEGCRAIVVGASWDLGAPLHTALTRAGADVGTVAAHAADLRQRCRSADLLISTAGVAQLIDDACIKPGAVVIDAGGSITDRGPVGDVDVARVTGRASLVVPHPGGIGPLTVVWLLRSTVVAAANAHSRQDRASGTRKRVPGQGTDGGR